MLYFSCPYFGNIILLHSLLPWYEVEDISSAMSKRPRSCERPDSRKRSKGVAPGVKNYVRRAIGRAAEVKYVSAKTTTSVDVTPTIISLANSSQGSTGGTHVGDACTVVSMELRYYLTIADTTQLLRVILFKWKPNMGYIAPAGADIIKDATSPWNLVSAYEEDGNDQYSIIYDRLHRLVASTSDAQAQASFKISGKSWKQEYLTATANCSNNIYMMLISDSGVVVHPTITWYSKIGFTDE